ncbi:unnamed protein product [Schistosoma curassoni]|uniref:PITH domain-containing protein n=1 Tax=Schistosoma curassoni TaxID=6186 RepID=A0A183K4B9_9TREM|nr:unnamed protein product [Schistosoma curassoni]
MQLDDVHSADDLGLLSHTQKQIKQKTTSVAAASAVVDLNIHKGKNEIFRYDTTRTNRIALDGEALDDIKTFTYLVSVTEVHGGSDADVKTRVGKARVTYLQLKNIWNSKNCQPTSKSEFSIRTSRQFYCMGRNLGELRKLSSRRYKCILIVVYARYFGSVGQTLSVTTRFQWRKKLGRSDGSG